MTLKKSNSPHSDYYNGEFLKNAWYLQKQIKPIQLEQKRYYKDEQKRKESFEGTDIKIIFLK